jgi:hypothetical protein
MTGAGGMNLSHHAGIDGIFDPADLETLDKSMPGPGKFCGMFLPAYSWRSVGNEAYAPGCQTCNAPLTPLARPTNPVYVHTALHCTWRDETW